MIIRVDVWRVNEIGYARIDDNQLRALAQTTLHLRAEDRVAIRRVGADDHDDVRVFNRIERLGARGLTDGVLQAIARWRMADACASIDVIRTERGTDHFLHEEGLLVRAAGRGDSADRLAAILFLDAADLARCVVDRRLPGHFLPLVGDLLADHRLRDAIRVSGVPEGKPALHTRVAMIRVAIAIRDHAN